jgi:TatD DNase family protein
MLIDTHCHIQNMIKQEFDCFITPEELTKIPLIIQQAGLSDVLIIINVGTSLIESINCITIANLYPSCVASLAIHPNDLSQQWHQDFKKLCDLIKNSKEQRIVAIGECGIDRHYPDHNLTRQQDAFRAHIELALLHDLPLIIHSRKAPDETLAILDEYRNEKISGVIHCFSEDLDFANYVIELGFVLGVGGTITYPKNESLRIICKTVGLDKIILETDAPFLPPQHIRGQQNSPAQIRTIATYLAQLRNEDMRKIAEVTTHNAFSIFKLNTFFTS